MTVRVPAYAVCVPTREIRRPDVPGARRVRCSECRTEVWASPSSLALIRRGVPPLCHGCAAALAPDLGPVSLVMTEQQALEAAGRRRRYAARVGCAEEDVVSLIPAELALAIEVSGRQN